MIPADHKWVTRALVASVLSTSILSLGLRAPEVSAAKKKGLAEAQKQLLAEKD